MGYVDGSAREEGAHLVAMVLTWVLFDGRGVVTTLVWGLWRGFVHLRLERR